MPRAKTLHVCHVANKGSRLHACRRSYEALEANGHDFEMNVFDRNRPFGLFTTGKRHELKRLSGQEKLPALELDDGTTVNGSGAIIEWAERNRSAA